MILNKQAIARTAVADELRIKRIAILFSFPLDNCFPDLDRQTRET